MHDWAILTENNWYPSSFVRYQTGGIWATHTLYAQMGAQKKPPGDSNKAWDATSKIVPEWACMHTHQDSWKPMIRWCSPFISISHNLYPMKTNMGLQHWFGGWLPCCTKRPQSKVFPESVWAQGSSNSGGLSLIFSSSHLLTFTCSHPHIFSSSHFLIIFTHSHPHIFTSSHLHIFSSSHPHIFTSSHLHIFSSSSHIHIFSSSHLWTWLPKIWKAGEHYAMMQMPAQVANRLFGQSCHMHRHRLLGKGLACLKGPGQNQASKVFQQVPDKVMRNGSNAVLHLTVQNLIPRTKRNRKWLQKEKRNMNIFMPGKLIACSAWNIIAR